MKASIGAEERLVFYFGPVEQELLGIKIGDRLEVERQESRFLFTSVDAKNLTDSSRTARILSVPKSSNFQARFKLSFLGMSGVAIRRSQDVGELLIHSTGKRYIDLPELFFSEVSSDHGAKVAGLKKQTFFGPNSVDSKIRSCVSTLNELVAKGDVVVRVRNGYLSATFKTTIGGDPKR